MEFRHTPDMGEISGFGGVYEDACQRMLNAGVQWLEERRVEGKETDLQPHELSFAFGVFSPSTEAAKELETVVLTSAPDCSGAMMHRAFRSSRPCLNVMGRLLWIAERGWNAYCEECRRRVREESKSDA